MKLYELLSRHGNFDILVHLIAEYPDADNSREGYMNALHELRTLKSVENKCQILVHTVEPDESLPENVRGERYVCVSGRGKDNPEYPDMTDVNFAIEFDPWEEWLGMEIMPESFMGRSEIEVLAHILWEMTFCGYSNNGVQLVADNVRNSYDDYKKDPSRAVELGPDFWKSIENDDDAAEVGGVK